MSDLLVSASGARDTSTMYVSRDQASVEFLSFHDVTVVSSGREYLATITVKIKEKE